MIELKVHNLFLCTFSRWYKFCTNIDLYVSDTELWAYLWQSFSVIDWIVGSYILSSWSRYAATLLGWLPQDNTISSYTVTLNIDDKTIGTILQYFQLMNFSTHNAWKNKKDWWRPKAATSTRNLPHIVYFNCWQWLQNQKTKSIWFDIGLLHLKSPPPQYKDCNNLSRIPESSTSIWGILESEWL